MATSNTQKIKLIDGWIEGCGDFLKDLHDFSNEHVDQRRFKGDDLVKAAGVSSLTTIYKAQTEGRLPPPDLNEKNRRLGATLEQVLEMQRYFKTSPSPLPGEEPQIISFTNFKGGCYKSTTAQYAGSYFANKGFKVLLVDLDPQATLTMSVGLFPDIDSSFDTSMAPYILDLEGAPADEVRTVVKKTYLPNMDIIPSALELASVEFDLTNETMEARNADDLEWLASIFYRVKNVLEELKGDYDIIILDGTPSLGLLPLNIILGSDTVIVPVPTEPADFASTRSFAKLYRQQVEILNTAFGETLTFPDMKFLPTRYSPSEHNATVSSKEILEAIRETFGSSCFDTVIRKHEAVVSNLSFFRRTVFDVNPGDCNVSRDARKKAIANFSTVFDEILEKVIYPKWESKKRMLEAKREAELAMLEEKGIVQ
ncbi:AAA family ATPase [Dasania marina]|uniref:ParA family protein n=1 Tax=Dasania marina TaxID=471499 RepID=UPI0030DCF225|tara:strand:- start:13106 stop:14383 length:1278 start_codon:yes stop_codon:yes gene_type:complete